MTDARGSQPCIDPIAERKRWISFVDRLLTLCEEIFKAANVEVTEKQFAEPKVLALALLCRTYLNLKGVNAVAREGLAVEARILACSCWENMFFVAGLVEKGDEFVEAMHDDDIKSLRSRGEFVLDDLGDLAHWVKRWPTSSGLAFSK
jgi:hypothetical protein